MWGSGLAQAVLVGLLLLSESASAFPAQGAKRGHHVTVPTKVSRVIYERTVTPVPQASCPAPSVVDGLNPAPDPDTVDPGLFDEAIVFDGDCSDGGSTVLQPTSASPALAPSAIAERGSGGIAERAPDNSAKLCFSPNGAPGLTIVPQTYPGAVTVAAQPGKGWISTDAPGLCGGGVGPSATRPSGISFVTEHVFEKQCLRNYIQYMTQGVLPGGAALPQGAATVPAIFDANGIFFQNWPAALPQAFGSTPVDTAFGLLGHTNPNADFNNLQVLDRNLNAIKAYISANKAFVSDSTFNNLDPEAQVSYLNDVSDTFNYMNLNQVIGSYNAAFTALVSFWQAFGQIPGAQQGYDYAGAFSAIVGADLDLQVETAATAWLARVQQSQQFWSSPQAATQYSVAQAEAYDAILQQFSDDIGTIISYNIPAMTT